MILSSSSEDESDVPIASTTVSVKTENGKSLTPSTVQTKQELEKTVNEKNELKKEPKAETTTRKRPAAKRKKEDDDDDDDNDFVEKKPKTRKTKSREPAKAKSKPKKSAKSGSGDGEADSDAPLGNQPSDANEDDIHDATEEDINNFKPGQTKPTPSPGCGDRVFYESLYYQNPDSFMALKWCVEYGVFPPNESEAMFKKLLVRKEQMRLEKK